jgi:hypothetical protein
MTLQNLLAIQRLQAFEPTAEGVQRLLAAAVRNLADAAVVECQKQAESLLANTRQWLAKQRPDLLAKT